MRPSALLQGLPSHPPSSSPAHVVRLNGVRSGALRERCLADGAPRRSVTRETKENGIDEIGDRAGRSRKIGTGLRVAK